MFFYNISIKNFHRTNLGDLDLIDEYKLENNDYQSIIFSNAEFFNSGDISFAFK